MSMRPFAGSDVIVEGRFRAHWVHQGYLEPQQADVDDDGILHVTSATQGTFQTRSELARLLAARSRRSADGGDAGIALAAST